MNVSICTYDEEKNKNNDEMKRKRRGNLKLLLDCFGGSSRRGLVAWRLPSALLHALLLQGAREIASRV